MYSMPNGVQEQDVEEGESGGEWHSDAEEDEESDDSSDDKEVDSPPRKERRSKHAHDPASTPDLATGQSSKRPRTSSPAPTEKVSKQFKTVPPPAPKASKATSSKPPKALPRIKVTVPTISG